MASPTQPEDQKAQAEAPGLGPWSEETPQQDDRMLPRSSPHDVPSPNAKPPGLELSNEEQEQEQEQQDAPRSPPRQPSTPEPQAPSPEPPSTRVSSRPMPKTINTPTPTSPASKPNPKKKRKAMIIDFHEAQRLHFVARATAIPEAEQSEILGYGKKNAARYRYDKVRDALIPLRPTIPDPRLGRLLKKDVVFCESVRKRENDIKLLADVVDEATAICADWVEFIFRGDYDVQFKAKMVREVRQALERYPGALMAVNGHTFEQLRAFLIRSELVDFGELEAMEAEYAQEAEVAHMVAEAGQGVDDDQMMVDVERTGQAVQSGEAETCRGQQGARVVIELD
ncbi:hypothetical protein MBLNU230_g6353t1 [Neophaeotheca triangularis]